MKTDMLIVKKLAYTIKDQIQVLNMQLDAEYLENMNAQEMLESRRRIAAAARTIFQRSRLLSEFSNINNLSVDQCNLITIIDALVIRYSSHPRFSDLQWQPLYENIEILGNEILLTTGLGNLIDNAFQYSEKDCPITISVELTDKKVMTRISNSLKRNHQDQNLNLNSTPYTYGKENGIGLMLSNRIIKSHGGNLSISISNKQAVAVIELDRYFTR